MNESERTRFRAHVQDRLEELLGDLDRGQPGTDTVELDQQAIGRLSRQDALLNQAMSNAQQGRRTVEINRLKAALQRIEGDEFGYCDDCGQNIPVRRLELDLAATKCVSCATG
ncbi:MAG: TraR/DksA C4-type zinc finger protein [Paracoccaceae bacterium]